MGCGAAWMNSSSTGAPLTPNLEWEWVSSNPGRCSLLLFPRAAAWHYPRAKQCTISRMEACYRDSAEFPTLHARTYLLLENNIARLEIEKERAG